MAQSTVCHNNQRKHADRLLQAAKKFEEEGVDDLVLLPKVTNEGIMLNLHKRYTRDRIYVCSFFRTADVVDKYWSCAGISESFSLD